MYNPESRDTLPLFRLSAYVLLKFFVSFSDLVPLARRIISYFSKSTLLSNWATAEPTLPWNRYQCVEIYLILKKKKTMLPVSTNLNLLKRHSRDFGSPEIRFPGNGRARIKGIQYYAMIKLHFSLGHFSIVSVFRLLLD